MLSVTQRRELSRITGVLSDLVVIPRIHADNHAIGRLEMLEGEFERRLDFMVAAAHPTGRQDLEAQTRLVELPDHFRHGEGVRGEERVADLDSDHRRHFFQFFGSPG